MWCNNDEKLANRLSMKKLRHAVFFRIPNFLRSFLAAKTFHCSDISDIVVFYRISHFLKLAKKLITIYTNDNERYSIDGNS